MANHYENPKQKYFAAKAARPHFIKTVVILSVSLVVVALFGVVSNFNPATGKTSKPLTPDFAVVPKVAGIADLIETVKPAVVSISVLGKTNRLQLSGQQFGSPHNSPFNDFFQHYFGGSNVAPQRPKPEFKAVGSGFIISSQGFVVTNSHVVKNADVVTITTDDGKQYSAEIKAIDPKTDLALLEINGSNAFPYVEFGNSDRARIGDQILAIGNPFGLGNTATTGIISARGRDIQSGPFDDFIQFDAPINQGNSGGPLFDMNGKVVGINTAIFSPNGGNVGIGFAIPATQANTVVEQLRTNGKVDRGWLGVRIQPLSDELADSLSLSDSAGALVVEVTPGSPAKRAGLEVGDVISEFNRKAIKNPKDLTRIVASSAPDQEYSVLVWREGKEQHLSVVTGETPNSQLNASVPEPILNPNNGKLGLALAPLNPGTRQQFRVNNDIDHGAIIVDVASGSPAEITGLRAGDVIVRIGNQEVFTPQEAVDAVKSISRNNQKHIMVLVTRGNNTRFVAINIA